MEIEFIPGKAGWIDLQVGPDSENLFEIRLSYIFDSCAELHKFFYYLINDQTGLSSTRLDQEGWFVDLKATPTQNPARAKLVIEREWRGKTERLSFTCYRNQATAAYVQAFRDFLDDGDYGGFGPDQLYLSEFETLFGNY